MSPLDPSTINLSTLEVNTTDLNTIDPRTVDDVVVPGLTTLGEDDAYGSPSYALRCRRCGCSITVVPLPAERRRHASSIWRLACASDCLDCAPDPGRIG